MTETADHPRIVGRPVAHDSAARHVRGTAPYVDDIVEPDGLLHVVPGGAPEAPGKITSLDLDAVRAAPGVVAVLTAADIPGVNDCSPVAGDEPIIAADMLGFPGQVIFAVVAETRLAARRAARLARLVIDQMPRQVTVEEGLAEGEDVLPPYTFRRGEVDPTLAQAPRRIEHAFHIGGQEHFYLEGQVALALPGEEGDMHLQVSTQHPSEVQHLVARMLGVPDAAIVCECRRMGGAFGGKESQAGQWACLAALAALVTGRPAKLRLDRDDDMIMTGKRHDFRVEQRLGFDEDGRLAAIDLMLAGRCGHSADLSLGINDRAMFHADNAYWYPATRIHSRRVRTHTVSNTAFRGFGGPQGMLAAERAMDVIAVCTGRDPLQVRLDNLYGPGRDVTPYGMRVEENNGPVLMRTLADRCDYAQRRDGVARFNAEQPILKKGLALTPVKFGISFTLKHLNQAGALVHVYGDGSVQLNHGGTEMGQGLYMKIAQVVAEAFGIPVDQVRITATRTDKVPNTSPTAASSGSDMNGMAALDAAEKIKARLAPLARRLLQGSEDAPVRFAGGRVLVDGRSIGFAELARQAVLERISLSATGFYATPDITWDRERQTGRPFLYFSWGAACSEVTIDTLTGEMRVDRVDILHDVGKSLNPAIDRGQIEGGFIQGLGWLTTEELVYDRQGRLLTHAPSTYKIPTAGDRPAQMSIELWDSPGNPAPTIHASKAVGEPPLMLAISVHSAIFHALASLAPGQVPELDAPATPEAIVRAARRLTDTARRNP